VTSARLAPWFAMPRPTTVRQARPLEDLVGGIPTPLKNMKVSWDYEIPNIWKNKNMFQTTNQRLWSGTLNSRAMRF